MKPSIKYIRELEAEAVQVKQERDALIKAGQAIRGSVLISGSTAHWRDHYKQLGESNPLANFDELLTKIAAKGEA